MSYDLTGQKVSFTYQNLLQYIDGSFYDGLGVHVPIADISTLNGILANYTPNSSLGGSFYWDASGFLEVSTNMQSGVFITEASLGSDFYWLNGFLYVDVSVVAGGVTKIYVDGSLAARDASIGYLYATKLDASIDYLTYAPRVSDVSFYYDLNANITNIISQSDIGVKTVDFVYNEVGDVSVITIDNYGSNQKQVTFESDIDGNIIAVHIM